METGALPHPHKCIELQLIFLGALCKIQNLFMDSRLFNIGKAKSNSLIQVIKIFLMFWKLQKLHKFNPIFPGGGGTKRHHVEW